MIWKFPFFWDKDPLTVKVYQLQAILISSHSHESYSELCLCKSDNLSLTSCKSFVFGVTWGPLYIHLRSSLSWAQQPLPFTFCWHLDNLPLFFISTINSKSKLKTSCLNLLYFQFSTLSLPLSYPPSLFVFFILRFKFSLCSLKFPSKWVRYSERLQIYLTKLIYDM